MPGAWEIAGQRDKRLLLGILTPPDLVVSIDFSQVIRNLQLPPGSEFMLVVGLPFSTARNNVARVAVDNGFNLAFLDADIRVNPDAYMVLSSLGAPLVSGLYYQRFWPALPVAFNSGRNEKGEHIRVPVTGWKPGDIFPADFVPAGLLVVSRPLMIKVFERHPLPFFWGIDVAPVPEVGGGQAYPASEDFTFSLRCAQLGYRALVHTGVVGLHECRAVVGPRWMIPMPSPDPLHGVVGIV